MLHELAEILSDVDAEIRDLEGKLSKARGVKAGKAVRVVFWGE